MDGQNPPALVPHPPLQRYYAAEKERHSFLRGIFDRTAGDYDRMERLAAFGTGSWYRRQALQRAGLRPGMRLLDVAMGTGLLAREAAVLTGEHGRVIGLEPSGGMLAQAAQSLPIPMVRARAEQLPLASDVFDFLSLGYALRHLADLHATFAEFFRVLKPGGTACVLEITPPHGRISLALLRCYMGGLVPLAARFVTRHADSRRLWSYYWETIEACVSPQRVVQSLEAAGFINVRRGVEHGIFSEYVAEKPELSAELTTRNPV